MGEKFDCRLMPSINCSPLFLNNMQLLIAVYALCWDKTWRICDLVANCFTYLGLMCLFRGWDMSRKLYITFFLGILRVLSFLYLLRLWYTFWYLRSLPWVTVQNIVRCYAVNWSSSILQVINLMSMTATPLIWGCNLLAILVRGQVAGIAENVELCGFCRWLTQYFDAQPLL